MKRPPPLSRRQRRIRLALAQGLFAGALGAVCVVLVAVATRPLWSP